MRYARWMLLLLFAAVAPAFAQRGGRGGGDGRFNHRQHAKLFPTCEGCHAGIATGNAQTALPTEAQCRQCHNGTDERVVSWRPAPRPVGLLRFSHTEHATKVDSSGRDCATCHAARGAAWMDVHEPQPETCLQCHAHAATAHLAEDNRCATCHVPLTAARDLSAERIARLPKPPTHSRADFPVNHAPATPVATATCAVCHARELCASCHVNASSVPAIAALGRDPRVASLVARRVTSYPTPADHEKTSFRWTHGDAARNDIQRCATCHARQSCEACHTAAAGAGANDVIRAVPEAEKGGTRGVELIGRPLRRRFDPPSAALPLAAILDTTGTPAPPARVVRVHDIGFRNGHRAEAASGAMNCASCHARQFCADCHTNESKRRFHPANFAVRHAADGYRRENECASCHNTEAFCRDCHRRTGLASRGRLDVAFHTAQPQWLLQHGRAARQGLANCTTCHTQRDCLTCHSTTGWGISPHGRDFDAARMAKSAPLMCLRCHVTVPGR